MRPSWIRLLTSATISIQQRTSSALLSIVSVSYRSRIVPPGGDQKEVITTYVYPEDAYDCDDAELRRLGAACFTLQRLKREERKKQQLRAASCRDSS
jgi:hypothetical protein